MALLPLLPCEELPPPLPPLVTEPRGVAPLPLLPWDGTEERLPLRVSLSNGSVTGRMKRSYSLALSAHYRGGGAGG